METCATCGSEVLPNPSFDCPCCAAFGPWCEWLHSDEAIDDDHEATVRVLPV